MIARPNVRRRFKTLEDGHLLVINTPSGPSEGFIRDILEEEEFIEGNKFD